VRGGCEEQAIAVHAIVRPFLVGAEILDRRLDLDDPDLAVPAERDQVGPPARCERQFAHAGEAERQEKPLRAARDGERNGGLPPVAWHCWRGHQHQCTMPRDRPGINRRAASAQRVLGHPADDMNAPGARETVGRMTRRPR
jgi:hypothetical protein